MNTTQNRLRNTIIVIGTLLILIVAFMVISIKQRQAPEFVYQNYVTNLENYIQSDTNFDQNSQAVIKYIDEIHNHQNLNDENTSIYDILPKATSHTSFVTSNDDQIRDMASVALEYAIDFYGSEDIKFIDAVYAVEERLAIYTKNPRSYLFFALTSDESKMVAIDVMPFENDYKIKSNWTLEQAGDKKFVENKTNQLLFIYTNKVF